MADIDVVKRRSNTWIWIVLIALALLAIWFFMAGGGTRQQIGSADGAAQPLAAVIGPLADAA